MLNKQNNKKEKNMLIQQGDVLIKKIDAVKGTEVNHLVLAEGEVTGHAHRVTEGDATLYSDNGTLYLHVESEKAVVTHEEHHAVTIPHGDYQIGIVKEYDHFLEEVREVKD